MGKDYAGTAMRSEFGMWFMDFERVDAILRAQHAAFMSVHQNPENFLAIVITFQQFFIYVTAIITKNDPSIEMKDLMDEMNKRLPELLHRADRERVVYLNRTNKGAPYMFPLRFYEELLDVQGKLFRMRQLAGLGTRTHKLVSREEMNERAVGV